MYINHKAFIAGAAIAVAGVAFVPHSSDAQEAPQSLRLSAPAPHNVSQGAAPASHELSQAAAQAPVPSTARGELLSVDNKAKTLSMKSADAETTYRFDDQTKVTGAHRGVEGLGTKTGSQVTIQYKKDGQTNLATGIDVSAATPAPASAR